MALGGGLDGLVQEGEAPDGRLQGVSEPRGLQAFLARNFARDVRRGLLGGRGLARRHPISWLGGWGCPWSINCR